MVPSCAYPLQHYRLTWLVLQCTVSTQFVNQFVQSLNTNGSLQVHAFPWILYVDNTFLHSRSIKKERCGYLKAVTSTNALVKVSHCQQDIHNKIQIGNYITIFLDIEPGFSLTDYVSLTHIKLETIDYQRQRESLAIFLDKLAFSHM